MSGVFLLDWAVLAVSLFNTIVPAWLGLTVLLNAEQRHAGIWLAGGGLLTGAGFFLSHTAILGFGLYSLPAGNFWWRVGWAPVIVAPYAWYVVMLWYAGLWERGPGAPAGGEAGGPARHRLWLALLTPALVLLLVLALPAGLLPSFGQVARLEPGQAAGLPGGRALLLLYAGFIVACIGLTLDALLRPGPTLRLMGGPARRRARPWLIAATLTLLAVSLLVAGFIGWAALLPGDLPHGQGLSLPISLLDLLISTLIGAAVLLTGQAVAAYEIFTGRSLPRRGLQHYWRRALILAVGYSAVVALSLQLELPAIYSLLLSTLLMVGFYALLAWRSYADRQRLLHDLRPFVGGPRLFGQMLDERAEPEGSAAEDGGGGRGMLAAVCGPVLNARLAALLPLGPLAALFGPPLLYQAGDRPSGEAQALLELARQAAAAALPGVSPETLCLQVGGAPHGAAEQARFGWIAPLWNERGLCGALVLGERLDGGSYTEEEIEVARAACERLVDLQAGVEMARRLAALQRRRMAESQVIDRRARQLIHDEVLPRLHAALLALSTGGGPADAPDGGPDSPQALLMDVHRRLSALLRDLPAAAQPAARLGLVEALRQAVQEEYRPAFERVDWQVQAGVEISLAGLSGVELETVYYAAREAVRNAARHARPADPGVGLALQVGIAVTGGQLEVCVQDNGAGMPLPGPGDEGGHGLALHSTLLAVLSGALLVETQPGRSTCVRVLLPLDPPPG
ncbi:MAG: sensor histidine kinase [Chloroflexota bacterium]